MMKGLWASDKLRIHNSFVAQAASRAKIDGSTTRRPYPSSIFLAYISPNESPGIRISQAHAELLYEVLYRVASSCL